MYRRASLIYDRLLQEVRNTKFSQISSKTFYYLADEDGSIGVLANRDQTIIEIDIASAYASLVQMLAPGSELAHQLSAIEDKRKKNILIALQCREVLSLFSQICALVVLLYLSRLQTTPLLLELKRDGAIFFAERNIVPQLPSSFLGFKFKVKNWSFYFRAYRTTILFDDNQLIRKGGYKYVPQGLEERISYLVKYKEPPNLSVLGEVYSQDFLTICRQTRCMEELAYWYDCDGKILLRNGRYGQFNEIFNSDVNSRLYLRIFFSPILMFFLKYLKKV